MEVVAHYPEHKPDAITITLEYSEAQALLMVAERIGGDPDGPRGIFSGREGNNLSFLLREAGVVFLYPDLLSGDRDMRCNGEIYFEGWSSAGWLAKERAEKGV